MPLTDLCNAVTLLSRLPVTRFAGSAEWSNPGRCVWAFPLVGLCVNALGALVYWLLHAFGVPPLAGAVWAVAATVLATGALHEDGLADTADGFGGGSTPERKLEIMRDSRIGCYGALALVLAVAVRVTTIAALADPRRVMAAMVVAGMLGRGGILLVIAALRPARPDGMAASLGAIPNLAVVGRHCDRGDCAGAGVVMAGGIGCERRCGWCCTGDGKDGPGPDRGLHRRRVWRRRSACGMCGFNVDGHCRGLGQFPN